ncbi:oligosaccharide flippase family protein [Campylobacter curvus]|uniref:oligosaccharide flippase family protein n=1 Tax=Campylobacter curvus TaxID=200 RepID=UPI00201651BC|nr:oligosaccharide flippase family protein [Campylobacter curvus]
MIFFISRFNKTKFIEDIGYTTFSKIVSVIVGFIIKIVMARLLTKEDFGIISVLTSISAYFDMIADFSTHSITQRNIINNKKDCAKHYFIYVNTKIITMLISVVLFIITAFLLGYFQYKLIICIMVSTMIINVLYIMPIVLLEAFENFKLYSKIMIYIAFVNFIFQCSFLYFLRSAEALFISLFFVSLSGLCVCYKIVGLDFKVIYHLQKVKFLDIKKLIQEAFPIFIGNFFYMLYYRIDTIMIEKMVGLESAAEYNLGFTIANQLLEILWVQFIIVFYPRMVQMYNESKSELLLILKQISIVLGGIYSLMFLISFFISNYVFKYLFGVAYQSSANIFTYMIIAMFFTSVFSLYYRILIIANKQYVYLYVMGFGAIVNFLLNLYFIYIYKEFGAIITTIIVNAMIFFIARYKANIILRRVNV